jgi:crotonobetainyl-CoA:carnitine CoA-transferase CaiB-like acyl-CoA transferase
MPEASMMRSNPLPLCGIRIVSVEQYGAGPWGTSYFSDLGAEVIKIENPAENGEVGRHVGPHFFGPGDSQFFQTFNRNKKSIGLDLKHPRGQQVLHALVRTADGVFDNLRGDLPGKLGVTYDALKQVKPDIVCAHLSAYGRDGSRAAWPGYDYLMQAEAGHMSVTGEPDGPPARYGLSIVDLMTGLAAAFALLAGITRARATGIGGDVDVSLFDVAMHNLNYPGTWYLNAGDVTTRLPRGTHPSLTPSQLYRTRDGWIFIMCNKEKFWRVLAEMIGKPEWADDPEFATYAARLRNRDRLTRMLDEVLMARDTVDWLEHFSGRVPAAPVNDIAQALENPFVNERDGIQDYRYADGRAARMVACPIRVAGSVLPTRAAPALGADTSTLLEEVGYDASEVAELKRMGVLS